MTLTTSLALAAGQAAPLYTNDDLKKFGDPTSAPGSRVSSGAPEDWQAIQAFIDRQYARIDTEQQHEFDRKQAEREAAAQDSSYRQDSYWLPYSNFWPPYGYGGMGIGSGGRGRGFRGGNWNLYPDRISMYPGSSGLTGAETQRMFLNQRPTIHGSQPLRQPQPPPSGRGGQGHGGRGHGGHGGGHARAR